MRLLAGATGLVAMTLAACGGGAAAGVSEAATTAEHRQGNGGQEHALPEPTPAVIRHVLNRFAFGPRPGDVEEIQATGMRAWFEDQLDRERIPDQDAQQVAQQFHLAFEHPARLEQLNVDVPPEFQEIRPGRRRGRTRLLTVQHYQLAAVWRHALSTRQVHEVMVDFWTNHFNVSLSKRGVNVVLGDYVETVLRPHALGRFEDLLREVMQHPAMLIYLDNASSSVAREGGSGLVGGINENLARELLELHTVGVDGGYSQEDVVAVARILSGWGVADHAFAFRKAHHDDGEKVVMGRRFTSGRGVEEGLELLHFLAHHPSTARFLSYKLARRFVSDNPPDELVERLAEVYLESDGDIRAVLRAIFRSDAFWAPENRNTKVKTPIEFVVSALRMTRSRPEGHWRRKLGVVKLLDERLRQPPFLEPVPTGYPEEGEHWATGAQMAARWLVARWLVGASGGVETRLDAVIERDATQRELFGFVRSVVGPTEEETVGRIRAAVAAVPPKRRRRRALALAFASPAFQRQ